MKRTRLLCLLPNLNGGGAERVMMYLVNGLDRARFDITLGVGRRNGAFVRLIPSDIETIELGADRGLFAVPRLAGLLRRGRFDVVFPMMSMNLAALLAREMVRARVPIVLGSRNHYSTSIEHEVRHPRVTKFAIRSLYRRADQIIGVSQGVCDDLIENFHVEPSRTRAIPNPLDVDFIRAEARKDPGHPWLQDTKDVPVIVNAGKLQTAKGQADLLEAFKKVRQRRFCRLMILGRGPLLESLQQLARDLTIESDVAFVGFQENPYQFMSRASLFVLSSHWEGFPNVLTEAMACGVPVISTDCPAGPSEIIDDGRNGCLTQVGNPALLAEKITTLLADEELRRRLAEQASEDVNQYRVATVIQDYAEVFSQMANGEGLT
jgi:glycosyltransferase involved in cell wall biosynthesis